MYALRLAPTLLVISGLSYGLILFLLSRRHRCADMAGDQDLLFVFVVPCLNEEAVIDKTINRLTSLRGPEMAVLVVDDGSDDGTSDIVRRYDPDKVWLLRRELPNARKGKGEALNAAFQYLRSSELLAGRDPNDVIVCICDADGRLEPHTLVEVAPLFRDPLVGAVQIGVRMYNAGENRLALMQDIEFVLFTEIFQRARTEVGNAGMGGNGQFSRLAALESLGDKPWSHCLTEDLELGLNFVMKGWRNEFCATAFVHQQAVTDLKRLIRQRTRWFQGLLQCWPTMPVLMRSRLKSTATIDLCYHLLAGGAMLVLLVYSLATMSMTMVTHVLTNGHPLVKPTWWNVQIWGRSYLLAFIASWFYGYVYWLRTPSISWWRALRMCHWFLVYQYIWLFSGVNALYRMVRKQSGWAKTARTADAPKPIAGAPAPVAG